MRAHALKVRDARDSLSLSLSLSLVRPASPHPRAAYVREISLGPAYLIAFYWWRRLAACAVHQTDYARRYAPRKWPVAALILSGDCVF